MLISFLTMYLPKTPYVMVYMLQQVEYSPKEFIRWGNRWPDFRRVMKRKKLVLTSKTKLLLLVAYFGWLLALAFVAGLVSVDMYYPAVLAVLAIPGMPVLTLLTVVFAGMPALQASRKKILARAEQKMANHPGIKIAVLGSYGKTTAKEILSTVLAQSKKVAVTPGNMNVDISHARWIVNKLDGDEDIVIFEYGEFRSGDIAKFAKLTHPNVAVLTGYAPNHLDSYGTAAALQKDLASIQDFVAGENLYVAKHTAEALPLNDGAVTYTNTKVAGWTVSDVKTGFEGTSFIMKKGTESLKLHSGLLGAHLVPLLALVAAIASENGLTHTEIKTGIAETKPFEHRMQPRAVNGAWVLDDTYNGNIEGMRAGLELLATLPAKKRIYVTPGLVEQGELTEAVHTELGELIAKAAPDEVVLMQNSVTDTIAASMEKHGYKGLLRIEADPLHYYEHMPYTLAHGDVVLMQNDWTDNYA